MISRRSRRSVWLRANFEYRSCADPCGPEAHNPETHDPTTHDPETYDSTTHDPKTRDPKEARVQEARGQEARVQEARGQEASDQEARDPETKKQMAYDQEAHHPETRARAQSKPELKKTNKKTRFFYSGSGSENDHLAKVCFVSSPCPPISKFIKIFCHACLYGYGRFQIPPRTLPKSLSTLKWGERGGIRVAPLFCDGHF